MRSILLPPLPLPGMQAYYFQGCHWAMEPRRGKCKLKCHKILINIQLFFLLKHSPGCNFWVSAQSSEKLITDIFFFISWFIACRNDRLLESLLCHVHSGKFYWPKCGAEAEVRPCFVSLGKTAVFLWTSVCYIFYLGEKIMVSISQSCR